MAIPVVEIHNIMEYMGVCTRPYVEGSAILNSNHLMECGILSRSEDTLSITLLGLCLQTSCLDGKPHEIRVIINETKAIDDAVCSCKAGSNKCKHILAVLLFLNRNSLENLEDLSCTDITQQWGKIKAQAKAMYEAVPARNFCHTEKKQMPYSGRYQPRRKTPEMFDLLRNTLLEGAPNSAIAVHMANQRSASKSSGVDEEIELDNTINSPTPSEEDKAFASSCILSRRATVQRSAEIDVIQVASLSPVEANFYRDRVIVSSSEAIDMCSDTTGQVGDLWHSFRKTRITGSRCYELYTYSKPSKIERNWEAKLKSILFSSFKGNSHTTYGLVNEPIAISAYERQTNNHVTKLGIIVNPNVPWMGYSPDGIVGATGRLIEVKCLMEGRSSSGLEMASKLSCVTVTGGKVELRNKHKYYGQVQLGMLLTGLDVCDFLLYSKFTDENLIIEVPFDEAFAEQLVTSLRSIYFHKLLPFLVANCS